MENQQPLITGQELIEAQKNIIGDLQHQNLINSLVIQKLQAQLQEAQTELGKYKPKEPSQE